ncbi:flagellar biosynthesis protein FlhB [Candidatus Magnetaquicoccus inordinatus]|uniref:flagellar biosynthesis protein FlhB n=1 Tax=Candidatus Magnetaquicoccus inordinatus TaxID=2496818 RepID=UPI00102C4C19|nr:flagellar biosynthesis protein FlhB [Candidatus Magnetaquicoccus inordinatus]
MAEETDKDSKTEDPTGKRLSDAREKGQVVNSREVSTAFVFLAATLLFFFQGKQLWVDMQQHMRFFFGGALQEDMTAPGLVKLLEDTIATVLIELAPFFIGFLLLGIGASAIQHGFLLSWEPVIPSFSKINPISGLARMFSTRSLVELLKSTLKIVIISYAVYWVLEEDIHKLLQLTAGSVEGFVHSLGEETMAIMRVVTGIFLAIALFDYGYQRFHYTEGLRMTKQEIKDEQKQMEGDPLIKGRIRQIQRELARRRMMEEVPKADVVITNPTHFATALLYKQGEMRAPVVTAKGRGEIAARIRAIAQEKGVPIVENPPLAQMLYKEVELGHPIPQELFKAVAEVLAYVYSLRHHTLRRSA